MSVAGPTHPLPNFCFDAGIACSRSESVTCSLHVTIIYWNTLPQAKTDSKVCQLCFICRLQTSPRTRCSRTLRLPATGLRCHICATRKVRERGGHLSERGTCLIPRDGVIGRRRVGRKKMRKSRASLPIQKTSLLRRSPHFRKVI